MNRRVKKRQFLHKMRHLEQYGFFYRALCPICENQNVFHYDRYDAKCCLSCNIWLEKNCGDPDCPYCANRPESPQLALCLETPRPTDALWRKTWRRLNYDHQERGRVRRAKRRSIIENKEDV